MEKHSKEKQATPAPPRSDKTGRHVQRSANEADVRGEMAMSGRKTKQDKNKTNDKKHR